MVFEFRGACFLVPPLSKVQGKCKLKFLRRRTRKLNFNPYVLNLAKINNTLHLSKVGSPMAVLSAIRA